VEDEHEALVELVDPRDERTEWLAERLGRRLEAGPGRVDDVADVVDDEADPTVRRHRDDVERLTALLARVDPEPPGKVDRDDDLAAEVEKSLDLRAGSQHAREGLGSQDLLDAGRIDTEVRRSDPEGGVQLLGHVGSPTDPRRARGRGPGREV